MPTSKPTLRVHAVAWWLGGDEECPHCGQFYAYEIEFRCPECDRPSCPHCRQQHAQGHNVCPECVNVAEESTDG